MRALFPLMHSLGSLLPALVIFGVLVIVHEWGHFIACRLSKIRVEKFSIGFGPELFHWQSKETRFSVALLPLGGFVSPAGEEASKVGPEGPKPGDFLDEIPACRRQVPPVVYPARRGGPPSLSKEGTQSGNDSLLIKYHEKQILPRS